MNIFDVEKALDEGKVVTREKWVNQMIIRSRKRTIDYSTIVELLGTAPGIYKGILNPEYDFMMASRLYLVTQNTANQSYEVAPYEFSSDDRQANDWEIITELK